ncbi:MarR family winged helix-turn-helix transcriptional regulator [Archangium lansingense]|uniref:MarR family transcriptional regulator n=1 Tax=Archangium lansingense TaxID=2995310 RepID=A0ABT4A4I9_9BACT|nr:MarR family transcriptional regulator [Archangium lansinium]MCY1076559.1 MarR family transcriptional regulator [Archangium lansinium]
MAPLKETNAAGTPSAANEAEEPLDEVMEFLRLLWAVDQGLRSISKEMETTLGLTGPQRLVVRLVGQYPGITAGGLAEILHVHPSTLTGVMKRLQKRGLVERKSDPLDARKALLYLTAAGRELNVPSEGTVEAAVQRALSRVPKAGLEGAQSVLTVLAEELGVGNAPLQFDGYGEGAAPPGVDTAGVVAAGLPPALGLAGTRPGTEPAP